MPWQLIVFWLVTSLISFLLRPKAPKPKPAELSDFEAPTAEVGRPVPVVFGTVLVKSPNVVWYGDLGSKPIKAKGGKK